MNASASRPRVSMFGRGRSCKVRYGYARRLAAIVLLQPALDAKYNGCRDHAYAWPGAAIAKGGPSQ